MKPTALATVALFVVLAGANAVMTGMISSSRADPHPIVSVIELLKKLKQDVVEQGQAEEVTYSKFAKWCADSDRTLSKAVKKSEESIDELEDAIASKTEENITLTREIAELADELGKHETADEDADKKRTAENNLYTAADKDFEDTVKAFDDAIKALTDAKPAAAGAALVQDLVGKLSPAAVGRLSTNQIALLANASGNASERPDLLVKGDYKNAEKKYTFKSDNIVELLKELKSAFEDQRVEATKAETNALNAHTLAKDARANAVAAATTAKSEKESAKQAAETYLTSATGFLKDTKDDLAADKATVSATEKQCSMRKSEWEERMTIRSKEKKAIEEGIKILGKATGVRTDAPTNPIPPAAPVSNTTFLQLQTAPAARALKLLRREATLLHSKSFMRFAAELEGKLSLSGPFSEVNDMIQKMIFRLMAEQKDEDDHKNWCDLELSKTNASIENKEQLLTELDLKLTTAKADVAELAQKIKDGDDMITKIDGFMEEATEVRSVGKAENKAAIEDSKKASAALAKAIAILQDFYKDSGMVAKEAWEFTQKFSEPVTLPENPAVWDSPYTGVSDPKAQPDGIISVLESIATDFSQMEANTRAQEATDEKNYQEEMSAQKIERARRTKEVEMRTQEKQRLSDKIISMEKSQKHVKDEKYAVKQYLKDLEPACIEGDSTYGDRKQARTDEIEALKEAQVILADADKNMTGKGTFLAQIHPARHA